MDCSLPGSSVHGDSPGKNSGVGCCALLQRIFPTQGSNPGLPHCRQILYHLSHQGSPRILEWVAYPFSSGTSQPRNWTRVSCIAGRFFGSWAIREAAQKLLSSHAAAPEAHMLKSLCSPTGEATTMGSLHTTSREEPFFAETREKPVQQQRPSTAKNNKYINFKN